MRWDGPKQRQTKKRIARVEAKTEKSEEKEVGRSGACQMVVSRMKIKINPVVGRPNVKERAGKGRLSLGGGFLCDDGQKKREQSEAGRLGQQRRRSTLH